MRIDRSDPADGPAEGQMARDAPSVSGHPDTADKDSGTAAAFALARPDSYLRAERLAYRDKVDAVYERYAVEHGNASAERPERITVTPDAPELADRSMRGGDVPDDPRNRSNPKTGRIDASWSTYDRAIAAARERTGGDLGRGSIKMYDYNPETGQGTGTLIGEQSPDRLRGWRIDGRDGHVNWWDWTGGKKGAGGLYGHDWFPDDPSTPGSRYIGWAPWQDSNGNTLEGN